LLHPYCPFVTEKLWASIKPKDADVLMKQPWPEVDSKLKDQKSRDDLQIVIDVITAIRSMRADHGVEQGKKIEAVVHTKKHLELLESQRDHIIRLGKLSNLVIDEKSKQHEHAASMFLKGVEVHIPLEGVIDFEKERKKLEKEKEKLEAFAKSIDSKLKNKKFVDNAPEDVVALEKEKLAGAQEKLTKIEERLKVLGS